MLCSSVRALDLDATVPSNRCVESDVDTVTSLAAGERQPQRVLLSGSYNVR